ncbi:LacI family DNA-binding transcriptional regulator [Marivita sp. S0852]|uniref:LacI family DNA-binding transcriptional regulator n=1 Tax=Marivita sp. S0852 TaxID=3373893 RepID=UPI003982C965
MNTNKVRNMEEFAALSGISRPTLSKYFHDPDSVRPSTRDRIEKALSQHDYRPNIYAVNQNRRMTKNIGIIVPYLADPFFAEIARNLERKVIDAGYSPVLFSAHGDRNQENEILDTLRLQKPAGVLLAPLGRISDRAHIETFCSDVPTVLFDSNLEGLGDAFVGSDNFSFVSQSVSYLQSTGGHPCFLEMANPANPNANKRRRAYLASMERLDLEPHVISVPGEGWGFEEIGYQAGLSLLNHRDLPTRTVLCSNDRLAIGFLAACYECGVRVGKDETCELRVAGHDGHPFSRYTGPSLTTVAHDYEAVSNRTVELLFTMIENGGHLSTREEILYPARLLLRMSA